MSFYRSPTAQVLGVVDFQINFVAASRTGMLGIGHGPLPGVFMRVAQYYLCNIARLRTDSAFLVMRA